MQLGVLEAVYVCLVFVVWSREEFTRTSPCNSLHLAPGSCLCCVHTDAPSPVFGCLVHGAFGVPCGRPACHVVVSSCLVVCHHQLCTRENPIRSTSQHVVGKGSPWLVRSMLGWALDFPLDARGVCPLLVVWVVRLALLVHAACRSCMRASCQRWIVST